MSTVNKIHEHIKKTFHCLSFRLLQREKQKALIDEVKELTDYYKRVFPSTHMKNSLHVSSPKEQWAVYS
jgi:hypothetical protein